MDGNALIEKLPVVVVSLEPDVLDLLETLPQYQVLGFLDADPQARDPRCANLGTDSDWPAVSSANPAARLLMAIDLPAAREKLVESFGIGRVTTVRANDASVSSLATVGSGSLLQRRVAVGRNSVIGICCKLNTESSVHHDGIVGDFSTLAPNARLLGNVRVGRCAYIGSGAIVLPRRVIGDHAIIGAGAVVTHDVPDGSTVVGIPARSIPHERHS